MDGVNLPIFFAGKYPHHRWWMGVQHIVCRCSLEFSERVRLFDQVIPRSSLAVQSLLVSRLSPDTGRGQVYTDNPNTGITPRWVASHNPIEKLWINTLNAISPKKHGRFSPLSIYTVVPERYWLPLDVNNFTKVRVQKVAVSESFLTKGCEKWRFITFWKNRFSDLRKSVQKTIRSIIEQLSRNLVVRLNSYSGSLTTPC